MKKRRKTERKKKAKKRKTKLKTNVMGQTENQVMTCEITK